MTEEYRNCEYDNYPIPPLAPSLSSEEQARQKANADKELEEAIQNALRELEIIK